MENVRNMENTENAENRIYTVTEVCPSCLHEIEITWDTDKMGFKAFCPVCGNRLMLCDACLHAENSLDCDYDGETDTCRHNKAYCVGREVRVWNMERVKPDGSTYHGKESCGHIKAYLGQDTYLVEMADGESIVAKETDLV